MSLAKNSLESRFILPDLRMLIKLAGSQSEAARRLGVSEVWIRDHLTGRRQHVSFELANRIGEILRGGRGLDEDWEREEHKREMDEARRIRERGRNRGGHLGRRKITHSDHMCTHCGAKADTAHALWMHSRSKHGDNTQGRNHWMTFRAKP